MMITSIVATPCRKQHGGNTINRFKSSTQQHIFEISKEQISTLD